MHSTQPGFRDVVPFPVVIVELDEQRGVPTPQDGIRMAANLMDDQCNPEAEAHVVIGKRVQVVSQDIAEAFHLL